ncbi:MAG TPA: S1/P1 nuclease, partial [Usitatibacter sp.]
LHAVWDTTLIASTVWSWGAYVRRLEDGWLAGDEARAAVGGTPQDWAVETHAVAREIWPLLPESRLLGDDYYFKVLPALDRQLGRAGLRLAAFLDDALSSAQCPVPGSVAMVRHALPPPPSGVEERLPPTGAARHARRAEENIP